MKSLFHNGIIRILIYLFGASLLGGCNGFKATVDASNSSLGNGHPNSTSAELLAAIKSGSVKLAMASAGQTRAVGTCSNPVSIQLLDSSGTPHVFKGLVGLDMSASSSSLSFYSDANCATVATTPMLQGSDATAVFYFKASSAGSLNLSASLLGLLSINQMETITTALTYTVSPSGTNVSVSPNVAQQVTAGATKAFSVTANSGYTLSNTVGGTCPAGSWIGGQYTTGAITANCSVIFSATATTVRYTVTPSGTNVTISPSGAQMVNSGATQVFTVTANADYSLSNAVSGTCPSGSWSGSVYTTGAISSSCTVIFSATAVVVSGVETPGPSAALLSNPTYALGIGKLYTCVNNFYVDGVNGNDANPGSQASPWKTIQHADSSSRTGGDCINVAPGTYNTSILLTHGGTQAASNGYVVYRCQTLNGCHVLFNGYPGAIVWEFSGSNYVVVDGFEIDGNGNDSVFGSNYGGSASTCFSSTQMPQYNHITSHHVWMLNNKIHDCNLGGIGFQSTEYIFSLHNEVYNTAWTSGYEGSGIGLVIMQPLGAAVMGETYAANPYPIYTPTAQDQGFAPYRIITAWNNVHDNGEATTLGATIALTTTANTHGNSTLDGLASVSGLALSQLVVGPGIQPFTYVTAIAGTSVTLSRPATSTATGKSFQFLNVSINHTDGNGIIYDTWAGTKDGCQNGCNLNTYPNQSLIFGNASHHNGGRGIHVFASSNVTVANNSTYGNGMDINYQPGTTASDLSQAGGFNNKWVNNIAVSVISPENANPACKSVVNGVTYSCGGQNMPLIAGNGRGITDLNNIFSHNVLYGGVGVNLWNNDATYFSATNNLVNKVFNSWPYSNTPVYTGTEKASLVYQNPTAGNFQLQSGSPAIGYYITQPYLPAWLQNAGAY